ncbi:unnamed protein product [[Candida] boidinii]|nr:unnamed protein product [[Candida] boidinii]
MAGEQESEITVQEKLKALEEDYQKLMKQMVKVQQHWSSSESWKTSLRLKKARMDSSWTTNTRCGFLALKSDIQR